MAKNKKKVTTTVTTTVTEEIISTPANEKTHIICILDRSGSMANSTGAANGGSYQSMQRGIFIANDVAPPSGNATGGGFLYVAAGALTWRGSAGTVTTLGAA